MDKANANRNIQCTVKECCNHCNSENYCALDSVSIGTHETNPTQCQCIDCESFVAKGQY